MAVSEREIVKTHLKNLIGSSGAVETEAQAEQGAALILTLCDKDPNMAIVVTMNAIENEKDVNAFKARQMAKLNGLFAKVDIKMDIFKEQAKAKL